MNIGTIYRQLNAVTFLLCIVSLVGGLVAPEDPTTKTLSFLFFALMIPMLLMRIPVWVYNQKPGRATFDTFFLGFAVLITLHNLNMI